MQNGGEGGNLQRNAGSSKLYREGTGSPLAVLCPGVLAQEMHTTILVRTQVTLLVRRCGCHFTGVNNGRKEGDPSLRLSLSNLNAAGLAGLLLLLVHSTHRRWMSRLPVTGPACLQGPPRAGEANLDESSPD